MSTAHLGVLKEEWLEKSGNTDSARIGMVSGRFGWLWDFQREMIKFSHILRNSALMFAPRPVKRTLPRAPCNHSSARYASCAFRFRVGNHLVNNCPCVSIFVSLCIALSLLCLVCLLAFVCVCVCLCLSSCISLSLSVSTCFLSASLCVSVNNCVHPLVVLVLCAFGTCRAFVVPAEVFHMVSSC